LTAPVSSYHGLSDDEIHASRARYGYNTIGDQSHRGVFHIVKGVITEPMFLLLTVACIIYFLTNTYMEGFVMLGAIFLVSGISLFQEVRSENALKALKKLTEPKAKVVRNGTVTEILTEEIVVGDIIQVEEGNVIPADALILQSNDFSVNESILTGESFSVARDRNEGNNQIYYGTLVVAGSAIAKVNAVGAKTEMGKIGKSLESVKTVKTPLQEQISSFVKYMAALGIFLFLIVWGINYLNSKDIIHGLLHGLTLAMSVLPEEIPVAFATFMALGAWRLMKNGILTKQLQTVESLGSATVMCIDKTGTITKNKMNLARIYDYKKDKVIDVGDIHENSYQKIIAYAMWASEPNPFDPMEKAIHNAYEKTTELDLRKEYSMIHEYPIGGIPPLMTHIYENEKKDRIIAAKGAWEGLISHSQLSREEIEHITSHAHELASEGYRVLGVAHASHLGYDFPKQQEDFHWQFLGLIALEDPPKNNIKEVFKRFYRAGIKLKIITGDYPETTLSIARKTGFQGMDQFLRGEEIISMSKEELRRKVVEVNIFARMFPDAKLKVIEALKAEGEVVSMTGDGVNDAPALKSAHIGVAMGKRGTETAKRSASIILLNDDLNSMAKAVAQGRRIYANLKKAIQYIISIHIPIMLTVALPLLLGWKYSNIFSPLHVIFFELIMGPTCSIIFENEPIEQRLMNQKPRKMTDTFFSFHELSMSIIQGLMITLGVLIIYYFAMKAGYPESVVRTLVFTTIIMSNVFLTLENRSFYYSIAKTIKYSNRLVPLIIVITLSLLILFLTIPAMRRIFDLGVIDVSLFFISAGTALLSVIWAEAYKWYRRNFSKPVSQKQI
jgi:Ca2+-transporting ATPase